MRQNRIPTQEVKDGKIAQRNSKGGRPRKPDFGCYTLRIHKAQHARLLIEAERQDLKKSAFISKLFSDYLRREYQNSTIEY